MGAPVRTPAGTGRVAQMAQRLGGHKHTPLTSDNLVLHHQQAQMLAGEASFTQGKHTRCEGNWGRFRKAY